MVEADKRDITASGTFDVQNGESAGGHSVSFSLEELIEEDSPYGTVFAEADYDSECFSFLPNADQLQSLDLKPGPNEIRFVISSRSACELRCRVFCGLVILKSLFQMWTEPPLEAMCSDIFYLV